MEKNGSVRTIVARRDILDLDGNRLVEARSSLDSGLMREVADRGKQGKWPEVPLMEFESFQEDLRKQMGTGSYSRIFGNGGRRETVERLMEPVRFPLPVLRGLHSFRRSDFYTYRHILMVFALSCYLAHEMLRESRRYFLEAAAGPLHDLGKVAIPMSVLRKSQPLQRSEWQLLEEHTTAGYVLLCYYLGDPDTFAARVARDHHERKDGSGYQRGILLDDPLVEIVSACDVYDALIMPRPYRSKSYDNRTALEEITAQAEQGVIGWDVVRHLVTVNRTSGKDPDACEVSLEKRGTPPPDNNYGVLLEDDSPPDA